MYPVLPFDDVLASHTPQSNVGMVQDTIVSKHAVMSRTASLVVGPEDEEVCR